MISFATLPHAYLTWTESAVALATFLRYQVYRRVQGDTSWTKIARITDRSITSFQDYNIGGESETYEYAVTQVQDVSGEEVESAFPTAVSATVTIDSVFLGDVAAPDYYVEIIGDAQRVASQPQLAYVQPWSRTSPTAHVGPALGQGIEVVWRTSWEDRANCWRTLLTLLERQKDNGSVFMVRHGRDVRSFCVIEGLERGDEFVAYDGRVTLREVHYREEVD